MYLILLHNIDTINDEGERERERGGDERGRIGLVSLVKINLYRIKVPLGIISCVGGTQ